MKVTNVQGQLFCGKENWLFSVFPISPKKNPEIYMIKPQANGNILFMKQKDVKYCVNLRKQQLVENILTAMTSCSLFLSAVSGILTLLWRDLQFGLSSLRFAGFSNTQRNMPNRIHYRLSDRRVFLQRGISGNQTCHLATTFQTSYLNV